MADRDRVGELFLVRAGSAAQRAADRAAHQGRLRIRLKTTAGLKFAQIAHRSASVSTWRAATTWRTSCTSCAWRRAWGRWCCRRRARSAWHEFLPAASIQPVGFADDEALLPVTLRSFQGYRLLQEYFSFPQRFRFFELTGLARALKRVDANQVELVILLGRGDADARKRRRRVESGAVLHAGDQPVPRSAPIAFMSATARTSITSLPTEPGRWISRSTR